VSYWSDYFGPLTGGGAPVPVPIPAPSGGGAPARVRAEGAAPFVPPPTLAVLRAAVARRLGDLEFRIWTADEIDTYLTQGYRELGTTLPLFFDFLYLENLPRGCSYTQPWERAFLPDVGGFDFGVGNLTCADDVRALGTERGRYGPISHTSPFEATDGFLATLPHWPGIPATADVPTRLTRLDRATWDRRVCDVIEARSLSRLDAQYQTQTGEVEALLWELDGVRTVRKYRRPARQADTVTVTGSWGLLRTPADLSGDPVVGTWGVCRRLPSHHPLGPERFGLPRRVFLDGKNVRLEHFRLGRPFELGPCELPTRYANYLWDYAMAAALLRPGPGQDVKLAAHFQERWQRNIARLAKRVRSVDAETITVLGGEAITRSGRPPRPKLPSQYGSVVR
jgi:hypothetical protein